MIRIMIVDDQQLFIDGMEALLMQEQDMQVVSTATNGKASILHFKECRPNLVLIDIHMPHTDAIKLILHMKEAQPDVKILVLTSFTDEDLIVAAIYAGADGFVLKNLHGDHLVACMRSVMRGEVVFAGEVAQILAKRILERKLDKRELLDEAFKHLGIHLSKRELDIAYLLAEGFSNKDIAQRLYLSEGTVKNYISNIYQTFQINNRKQLMAYFKELLEKKPVT
ncbi:DNA-binding response regulator [Virgibacillus pantothenticus]|nr:MULTISPECIES: response regulator transcription factor [Virgibacillus]MBS7428490.1 response regulator transcription factor [Virgibacillus sp. 19R1-5]MED3736762.1 response regulator transcription factor [Virgibacillus pantothenticus]QTY15223.1 response regulator transcription factor [Virgibacillus pantothenticus]SIT05616.1 two component transcriptional regulator, LuxR family [Virgibacillus pantothenticus]GIP62955.1 DNA-binding response regulator [Virgibacillus pantothenticus]